MWRNARLGAAFLIVSHGLLPAQALGQGALVSPAAQAGAYLGLRVEPADDAKVRHAVIVGVDPGSPAALAKMQVGDEIYNMFEIGAWFPNSARIRDQASLQSWLASQRPGSRQQISAARRGRTHNFAVRLAARPVASSAAIPVLRQQAAQVEGAAAEPQTIERSYADLCANRAGPESEACVVLKRALIAKLRGRPAKDPPVALPSEIGSPSWFCGAFDANYAAFYRSAIFQSAATGAVLKARWTAQLRARHAIATPQLPFCLSNDVAADLDRERNQATAQLVGNGAKLVDDSWAGAAAPVRAKPPPKRRGA